MRILIVSGTHKHNDTFVRVLERIGQVEMVIHCGDAEGGEYFMQEIAGCPLHIVMGNNDFFSELPKEITLNIKDMNILITHGHDYYVNSGYEVLRKEAKARGFQIVMFGHTHRPVIDQSDGIVVLNPGSLTYPRQEGKRPSYIVMEVNKKGEVGYSLEFL